ncbi:hypothetical protein ACJJTC_000238 [Scirpophaga incertulas]
MVKNLNAQQIERLLNDLKNEDSENDEIFPELLSDLSNAEYFMSRYKFLEELEYALVIPRVLERRRLSNLSKELKDTMGKFLREIGVDVPEDLPHKELVKIKNQRNLDVICTHEVNIAILPEFAPNV